MNKNILAVFVLVMVAMATILMGCSGGDSGGGSNADIIAKYNKGLPPVDPNAPPPVAPVREDMKGGNPNMPMKGGR